MSIQSKNPTDGKLIKTFNELTPEELEEKISTAEKVFQKWKSTSFAERKVLLRKLGQYLRDHAKEFSEIQALEMGKTVKSGISNLEKCASLCDYYADNAEKILAPESIPESEGSRIVRLEPLGIVLAVMPWNFPFWQVYRFAVPAIMAGNVGLLKHASNVPQCAGLIEQSFRMAGFPEGVFQNLLLPSNRVEGVIRDPRIQAIALTGSEKAGSDVARVAGEEIKKSVLELGGSDPFIVFADADLSKAAEIAVEARLQNNTGQSCISAKRFIVEDSIARKFAKRTASIMDKLKLGDPSDPDTDIGPLALESIRKEVNNQVQKSISLGAELISGGKMSDGNGYFYPPTVLFGAKPGMPIYDEEVFGPVLSIIPFKDEADAVRIANDTRYGLGASIFTGNKARAERLIPLIDAGNVFINSMVKSDPKAPFGGVKKSGFGRELGSYGIKEFVNIKNVFIQKK